MNRFFLKVLALFVFYFCFCFQVFAAEVLQVTSSSVLLIGDHNRTYTVKLACAEISPEFEEESIKWLKKQLPRHSKVNLRPKGSEEGFLLAKVIPFNSKIDITEKYVNEGYAQNKC